MITIAIGTVYKDEGEDRQLIKFLLVIFYSQDEPPPHPPTPPLTLDIHFENKK